MKIPTTLAALVLCVAAPAALADTLKVPTEEYETIQSAVDAAEPGDTIVVSPGSYAEGVGITGKSDLEIRGRGWPEITSGGFQVDGGSSGILVRGFEFDGTGVVVSSASDVVLTKLRFRDVDNAIQTGLSDHIVISKCEFLDISADAIVDNNTAGFTVEKCRFENLVGWAIGLTLDGGDGTTDAVISKNRISNAVGGVWLGGMGALVEKNRMEGLANLGVQCNGFASTAGSTISKNRIETSSGIAIQVATSAIFVEKNTLVGGGINSAGTAHVLDRNKILDAVSDGIVTSGACTLLQNSVRRTSGVGILVQGNLSVLERNSVADSDGHGFVIAADDCDLDRNSAARADENGFLVDGTGNTFTRNKARGSGLFDLADTTAPGANTYEGNHFGTTQFNYVP